MDVHHYNSRLFSGKCSALAHIALPSTLLEAAGVAVNHTEEEEWRVSVRTEKMTGGRSRIFQPMSKISTDPLFTKQECGCVLITSIPLLFLEKSIYNGLDVAVLRVISRRERCAVHLRFFYLTLISCLRRNCESPVKQPDAGPDPKGVPDAFGLILREVAETKKDPCGSLVKTDPTIYALAEMLDRFGQSTAGREAGEPHSKHHPALENPGLVRSAVGTLSTAAAPLLTLRRPQVRVDVGAWTPKTVERAISLLYGVSFWVFLYPECKWSPEFTDWFHTLPASTLESLRPLAGFEARGQFVLRKQAEFAATLLASVERMGGVVPQALPFCLTGDIPALSSMVMAACQALLLQETEYQAWIRAGLSLRDRKPGLWCEVNDLASSRLKCGRDLFFIKRDESPEEAVSEPDWSCLFQHSRIQRAVGAQDLFCVAVDEVTLAAALILPGGFLIKGHYSISEEDRLFLRRNYGFFDRPAVISQ